MAAPAKVEVERPVSRQALKSIDLQKSQTMTLAAPAPKSSDWSMVVSGCPNRSLLAEAFFREDRGLTA